MEAPLDIPPSAVEAPHCSGQAKPVDEAVSVRFDLLLTDNPALAGMPSAFKLNAAEAKCTYTEVMEFLTTRTTPKYNIKKLKKPVTIHSQQGSSARGLQATPRAVREGQGMSLATGSKRVLGCLRRPRERFDFGASR